MDRKLEKYKNEYEKIKEEYDELKKDFDALNKENKEIKKILNKKTQEDRFLKSKIEVKIKIYF